MPVLKQPLQKPDLVAVESKILHSQRKHKNHEATREAASKDAKKKEELLNNLKKDLAAEQKALNTARGKSVPFHSKPRN